MRIPDDWFFSDRDLPIGYRDDDDDDDGFIGTPLSTNVWGDDATDDERLHANDRRDV